MSWFSLRRARRDRSRVLHGLGACGQCGHAWADHPGAWPHLTEVCDECDFEAAHGQRDDEPTCTTPCPLLTVAQVQALGKLWGGVLAGARAPCEEEAPADDEIDSWFAGVLSSQQASRGDLDALQRLALDPRASQTTKTLAATAHLICTRPAGVA